MLLLYHYFIATHQLILAKETHFQTDSMTEKCISMQIIMITVLQMPFYRLTRNEVYMYHW